jgi:hypothetical protein
MGFSWPHQTTGQSLPLRAHIAEDRKICMSAETLIQQIQTPCDGQKDKRKGALMFMVIWDVCEVRGENKVDAPRLERVWSRRAPHVKCGLFKKR